MNPPAREFFELIPTLTQTLKALRLRPRNFREKVRPFLQDDFSAVVAICSSFLYTRGGGPDVEIVPATYFEVVVSSYDFARQIPTDTERSAVATHEQKNANKNLRL